MIRNRLTIDNQVLSAPGKDEKNIHTVSRRLPPRFSPWWPPDFLRYVLAPIEFHDGCIMGTRLEFALHVVGLFIGQLS